MVATYETNKKCLFEGNVFDTGITVMFLTLSLRFSATVLIALIFFGSIFKCFVFPDSLLQMLLLLVRVL